MAKSKVTSTPAASAASKTLKSSDTAAKSKSGAGSALAQAKSPGKATSAKAASSASKALSDGRSATATKSAAGSALAQRRGK